VSGVDVGPASIVRGAGVALATLAPSVGTRLAALGATYGAAWKVRPGGLTFFSYSNPDHDNALVREYAPVVSSGVSWLVVHAGVVGLLRRRTKHRLLAGIAYGGAITVVDSFMAAQFEAMRARRDELARRPKSD
jgi:hypothetical protein